MDSVLEDLHPTGELPRLPEPPNVVPPVDERWREYRQQLTPLPAPDEAQRVDLPEPVFAPWLGRVRDDSHDGANGGKHHVKRVKR